MKTIFKREFLGYYRTPVGYVFMGVFLALAGLIFYLSNLKSLSGDLLSFLSQLTLLNMLLCPLLTMRLICEERQKRTDQLLLTAPVSLASAVLGKYFAAAAVLLLTILCSNLYTLIIAFYGTVYAGEWFVGYLGFTLQSLSFLALDLLVSCFAKNQITEFLPVDDRPAGQQRGRFLAAGRAEFHQPVRPLRAFSAGTAQLRQRSVFRELHHRVSGGSSSGAGRPPVRGRRRGLI